MFEVAGSYGPILLGLGGLGGLMAVVFAVIGILGKRVPLFAWVLMPAVITLVGAFASYSATGTAEAALAGGGVDTGALSSIGLAEAYGPRWLAHWAVAALSVFSIWCAALSALIKPGGETRSTPFVAVVVFLIAALSPAGTLFFAMSKGMGTEATAMIGLLAVGGVGCALIAFRRALHEAAYRVASLRFAAGVLMIIAAAHGVRALVLSTNMDRLMIRGQEAIASAVGEEQISMLKEATTAAITMQADVNTLAWLLFGISLAAALFTFLGELGEVVDKFTLVDVSAAIIVLAGVGGFRFVETEREAELAGTARLHPLGDLVSEYGFQLPAAAVAGYTKTFDLRGETSLFGDIVVYGTRPSYQPPTELAEGEEPPPPPVEWFRAYKWTGHSWIADDTPLAEVTPSENYPVLIAGPGNTPSADLVELLEQFGGEAHVLLRVSEPATVIDPELAWTDARWMHLKLSDSIDYNADTFVQTERFDPYVGVARFIHAQGTNDKPVHRLDDLFTETGITNVRATTGERVRLDHIATLCLSTHITPGLEPEIDDPEDAPTAREGIDCTIVDITIDDAIAGAVEALGLPESDNVRMEVEVEEGIDAAAAQTLQRELAAFGACAAQVKDNLGMEEDITGRLAGSFTIDDRGRAGRFEFEAERRDIDIYDMKLCVRERLEWARFPEYIAPPEPEPAEVVEGEEPEEVEPTPTPRVKFELRYR